MIHLLYGSDTRASRKKFNEIVDEYRKKYGHLNIYQFDAEEDDGGEIKEAIKTRSLFAAQKLVVIKYFSLCPEREELYGVLEAAQNDSGASIVLWERALGAKELASVRPLCRKIQEFKEGNARLPEESIFQLGDAFFSNKRGALRSLLRLLDQGHDDFNLFSYLSNHARTLTTVKHYEDKRRPVSEKHGIHPFVIKKAVALVRDLNSGQLQVALQSFFEEDLKVKTGSVKPKDSLFSLLLSEPREARF